MDFLLKLYTPQTQGSVPLTHSISQICTFLPGANGKQLSRSQQCSRQSKLTCIRHTGCLDIFLSARLRRQCLRYRLFRKGWLILKEKSSTWGTQRTRKREPRRRALGSHVSARHFHCRLQAHPSQRSVLSSFYVGIGLLSQVEITAVS